MGEKWHRLKRVRGDLLRNRYRGMVAAQQPAPRQRGQEPLASGASGATGRGSAAGRDHGCVGRQRGDACAAPRRTQTDRGRRGRLASDSGATAGPETLTVSESCSVSGRRRTAAGDLTVAGTRICQKKIDCFLNLIYYLSEVQNVDEQDRKAAAHRSARHHEVLHRRLHRKGVHVNLPVPHSSEGGKRRDRQIAVALTTNSVCISQSDAAVAAVTLARKW